MKLKSISSKDFSANLAAKCFVALNPGKVCFVEKTDHKAYTYNEVAIVTDVRPDRLIYPEGWGYSAGCFKNLLKSKIDVPMFTSDGIQWNLGELIYDD